MLQRILCCISELRTLDQIVGAKPLLRKLLLKMDNYVKIKRIRFVSISIIVDGEGCV